MGSTNSQFASLVVPDDVALDDVPYWLSQLVNGLDQKVVGRATSNSDRDSRFYGADAGLVCVVANAGTATGCYVKTSAANTAPTWGILWQPPLAPAPVPLTLVDGFQATNGKTPVAVYDAFSNRWALWGNVNLVAGGTVPNNTTFAYLPSQVSVSSVVQPYYDFSVPTSLSPPNAYAVGKVNVNPATGALTFYGSPAPWIGLDGASLPAV